MASIPTSIIFDILSHLPVKALARFKILNNLCRSFIINPEFILTHVKNSANKANDNLCLIFSCEEHEYLNSQIHFLSLRDNDEVAVLEYSAPVSFGSYEVLPSCNGLVCFYGLHGGVHVCNPITKDIGRLPDIDAEGFQSLSYGFGFDEMNGKHKVIQFLEPQKEKNNLRIEIFTMGDNSWKTKPYRSCYGFHEPPVFAGGFFYWITSTYPRAPEFSIVSFDIGNEIFEDISPPESISKDIWYNDLYLVGLRGDLCLVHLVSAGKRMDIWILKRNVVEKKENWVRATIVHQSKNLRLTRPVAINGDEILLHGFIKGLGNLHSYNLQTGCFRQLKINGTPSQRFHVSHHVESLFPININPCEVATTCSSFCNLYIESCRLS